MLSILQYRNVGQSNNNDNNNNNNTRPIVLCLCSWETEHLLLYYMYIML